MSKTKIIIFTGKSQSGKDTSGIYVKDFLERKFGAQSAEIYSFAFALKQFLVHVFGIPASHVFGDDIAKSQPTHIRWVDLPLPAKQIKELRPSDSDFMSVRELLQVFGTDICRKMWGDCWAYSTLQKISNEMPKFALICDARFVNEVEIFFLNKQQTKEFHNTIDCEPIIIRLLRNTKNSKHLSEIALDNYDFQGLNSPTLILDNSNMTMEEKNEQVCKFVKESI